MNDELEMLEKLQQNISTLEVTGMSDDGFVEISTGKEFYRWNIRDIIKHTIK